ncbi:hypothetical protein FM036_44195 [Nostoc sp. HG1]|nr:hypothetical protein [Nostoc sp. HG1]
MFINLNVIVTCLRPASILGNNQEFGRLSERALGWAGLWRAAQEIWRIPEQSADDRPTASQERACGVDLIGDRTGDRPFSSQLHTPK